MLSFLVIPLGVPRMTGSHMLPLFCAASSALPDLSGIICLTFHLTRTLASEIVKTKRIAAVPIVAYMVPFFRSTAAQIAMARAAKTYLNAFETIKPAKTRGWQEKFVRRAPNLSATAGLKGRPVMPGCRSETSKVPMMSPVHSESARVVQNPTIADVTQGTAMDRGGPNDDAAYDAPDKGRSKVNSVLRPK